jgi:alkylation response protein AidB-like acyl-CoA dehydrogenase
MSVAITPDHRALEATVRDWAVGQAVRAETRAALDEPASPGATPGQLWKAIVDLGWPGIVVPEADGGAGYGLHELVVVLENLGREVYGGPLLPTAVVSGFVAAHGSADQRADLLPGLLAGTTPAAIAAGVGTVRAAGDGYEGVAGPALGAVWATLHAVFRDEDVVLLRADETHVTAAQTLDPSLGIGQLSVNGRGTVVPGAAASLRRWLRVAVAAEAAGNARATLDIALEYAKVREQFGRPIGSFQAIKHHLADMLVRSELAVAAAWDAARVEASSSDGREGHLAAAAAARTALHAAVRNAETAIQVLGGIGFTWEHDAHLFLRRAATLAGLVGPIDQLEREVTALVAAGVGRNPVVQLPPEAEMFRQQARDFAERWHAAPAADRRRLLVESGYLVPHWDAPWGRAANPVEQLVIDEELSSVDVPDLVVGGWVLRTLAQNADAEQVRRWVGPGLLGELKWCQLFSEPGAGSDAAAVTTRGVRVDGGWQVTGQKVWTSHVRDAHRGLATIRTDPLATKHAGITTVVIDMSAPGVTVRPLREITGETLFSEVFIDDVFVPDSDVVGEPGGGWAIARATLANERVGIGSGAGAPRWSASDLVALADRHSRRPEFDAEIGALLAESYAARMLNARAVERAMTGAEPSVEGNVSKLILAEGTQRATELGMRIAAGAAVAGDESLLAFEYLFSRCSTIAGGTSEVSRNVIAERILGLPRGAVFN